MKWAPLMSEGREKMKKIIVAMVLVMLWCSVTAKADEYEAAFEGKGTIKEYWTGDLTIEILENRGADIVIEKIIGRCLDEEGNGEILNCSDPYNYICYASVEDRYVGALILTICIYRPNSNLSDDIEARFDYVL